MAEVNKNIAFNNETNQPILDTNIEINDDTSLQNIKDQYTAVSKDYNTFVKNAAEDVGARQQELIGNNFGAVSPYNYNTYYEPGATSFASAMRTAGTQRALEVGMERGKKEAEAAVKAAQNNYNNAVAAENARRNALANSSKDPVVSGIDPNLLPTESDGEKTTAEEFAATINNDKNAYLDRMNEGVSNWNDPSVVEAVRNRLGTNSDAQRAYDEHMKTRGDQGVWENFSDSDQGRVWADAYADEWMKRNTSRQDYDVYVKSYDQVRTITNKAIDLLNGVIDQNEFTKYFTNDTICANPDYSYISILSNDVSSGNFDADFSWATDGVTTKDGRWISQRDIYDSMSQEQRQKYFKDPGNNYGNDYEKYVMNPELKDGLANSLNPVGASIANMFGGGKGDANLLQSYKNDIYDIWMGGKPVHNTMTVSPEDIVKAVTGVDVKTLSAIAEMKRNNPDDYNKLSDQVTRAMLDGSVFEIADGDKEYYTADGYKKLQSGTVVMHVPDFVLNDDGSPKDKALQNLVKIYGEVNDGTMDQEKAQEEYSKNIQEYMTNIGIACALSSDTEVPIDRGVYAAVLYRMHPDDYADLTIGGKKISDIINDFSQLAKKDGDKAYRQFSSLFAQAYNKMGYFYAERDKNISALPIKSENDSTTIVSKDKDLKLSDDDAMALAIILTASMNKFNNGNANGNLDPAFLRNDGAKTGLNLAMNAVEAFDSVFAILTGLLTGIGSLPATLMEHGGQDDFWEAWGKNTMLAHPIQSIIIDPIVSGGDKEGYRSTVYGALTNDVDDQSVRGQIEWWNQQGENIRSAIDPLSVYAWNLDGKQPLHIGASNDTIEGISGVVSGFGGFMVGEAAAEKLVATAAKAVGTAATRILSAGVRGGMQNYATYTAVNKLDDAIKVLDSIDDVPETAIAKAGSATAKAANKADDVVEAVAGKTDDVAEAAAKGANKVDDVTENVTKITASDAKNEATNAVKGALKQEINSANDNIIRTFAAASEDASASLSIGKKIAQTITDAITDSRIRRYLKSIGSSTDKATVTAMREYFTDRLTEAGIAMNQSAYRAAIVSAQTGLPIADVMAASPSTVAALAKIISGGYTGSNRAMASMLKSGMEKSDIIKAFKNVLADSAHAARNGIMWSGDDVIRALVSEGWGSVRKALMAKKILSREAFNIIENMAQDVQSPTYTETGETYHVTPSEWLTNPANYVLPTTFTAIRLGGGAVIRNIQASKYLHQLNAIDHELSSTDLPIEKRNELLKKYNGLQAKAQAASNKMLDKSLSYSKMHKIADEATKHIDEELDDMFKRNGYDTNYVENSKTLKDRVKYWSDSGLADNPTFIKRYNERIRVYEQLFNSYRAAQTRAITVRMSMDSDFGAGKAGHLASIEDVDTLVRMHSAANDLGEKFAKEAKEAGKKFNFEDQSKLRDQQIESMLDSIARGSDEYNRNILRPELRAFFNYIDTAAKNMVNSGLIKLSDLEYGYMPMGSMFISSNKNVDEVYRGLYFITESDTESSRAMGINAMDPTKRRTLNFGDAMTAFRDHNGKFEYVNSKGDLEVKELNPLGLTFTDMAQVYTNSVQFRKGIMPIIGDFDDTIATAALKNDNILIHAARRANDAANADKTKFTKTIEILEEAARERSKGVDTSESKKTARQNIKNLSNSSDPQIKQIKTQVATSSANAAQLYERANILRQQATKGRRPENAPDFTVLFGDTKERAQARFNAARTQIEKDIKAVQRGKSAYEVAKGRQNASQSLTKGIYEVSTAGDKRFSALNAKFNDGTKVLGKDVGGMTIEDAYQKVFKQSGKGKAPAEGSPLYKKSLTGKAAEDYSYKNAYLPLWQEWAKQNPKLIEDLRKKSAGKTLNDKFAKTGVSQARALTDILGRTTTAKDFSDATYANMLNQAARNNGYYTYDMVVRRAYIDDLYNRYEKYLNNDVRYIYKGSYQGQNFYRTVNSTIYGGGSDLSDIPNGKTPDTEELERFFGDDTIAGAANLVGIRGDESFDTVKVNVNGKMVDRPIAKLNMEKPDHINAVEDYIKRQLYSQLHPENRVIDPKDIKWTSAEDEMFRSVFAKSRKILEDSAIKGGARNGAGEYIRIVQDNMPDLKEFSYANKIGLTRNLNSFLANGGDLESLQNFVENKLTFGGNAVDTAAYANVWIGIDEMRYDSGRVAGRGSYEPGKISDNVEENLDDDLGDANTTLGVSNIRGQQVDNSDMFSTEFTDAETIVNADNAGLVKRENLAPSEQRKYDKILRDGGFATEEQRATFMNNLNKVLSQYRDEVSSEVFENRKKVNGLLREAVNEVNEEVAKLYGKNAGVKRLVDLEAAERYSRQEGKSGGSKEPTDNDYSAAFGVARETSAYNYNTKTTQFRSVMLENEGSASQFTKTINNYKNAYNELKKATVDGEVPKAKLNEIKAKYGDDTIDLWMYSSATNDVNMTENDFLIHYLNKKNADRTGFDTYRNFMGATPEGRYQQLRSVSSRLSEMGADTSKLNKTLKDLSQYLNKDANGNISYDPKYNLTSDAMGAYGMRATPLESFVSWLTDYNKQGIDVAQRFMSDIDELRDNGWNAPRSMGLEGDKQSVIGRMPTGDGGEYAFIMRYTSGGAATVGQDEPLFWLSSDTGTDQVELYAIDIDTGAQVSRADMLRELGSSEKVVKYLNGLLGNSNSDMKIVKSDTAAGDYSRTNTFESKITETAILAIKGDSFTVDYDTPAIIGEGKEAHRAIDKATVIEALEDLKTKDEGIRNRVGAGDVADIDAAIERVKNKKTIYEDGKLTPHKEPEPVELSDEDKAKAKAAAEKRAAQEAENKKTVEFWNNLYTEKGIEPPTIDRTLDEYAMVNDRVSESDNEFRETLKSFAKEDQNALGGFEPLRLSSPEDIMNQRYTEYLILTKDAKKSKDLLDEADDLETKADAQGKSAETALARRIAVEDSDGKTKSSSAKKLGQDAADFDATKWLTEEELDDYNTAKLGIKLADDFIAGKTGVYKSADGTGTFVNGDRPSNTVNLETVLTALGASDKNKKPDLSKLSKSEREAIEKADKEAFKKMKKQLKSDRATAGSNFRTQLDDPVAMVDSLDTASKDMTRAQFISLLEGIREHHKGVDPSNIWISKGLADLLVRYADSPLKLGQGHNKFVKGTANILHTVSDAAAWIQQQQLAGGYSFMNALTMAQVRSAMQAHPEYIGRFVKMMTDMRSSKAAKASVIENMPILTKMSWASGDSTLVTDLGGIFSRKANYDDGGVIQSYASKILTRKYGDGLKRIPKGFRANVAEDIEMFFEDPTFMQFMPVFRAQMAAMNYDAVASKMRAKFGKKIENGEIDAAEVERATLMAAYARTQDFFAPQKFWRGNYEDGLNRIYNKQLREFVGNITGEGSPTTVLDVAGNVFFALRYKQQFMNRISRGVQSIIGIPKAIKDYINPNTDVTTYANNLVGQPAAKALGSLAMLAGISALWCHAMGIPSAWDDLTFEDEDGGFRLPEVMLKWQNMGQIWLPNDTRADGTPYVNPDKSAVKLDTMFSMFTIPNTISRTIDYSVNPEKYYASPQRGLPFVQPNEGINSVLNAGPIRAVSDELIGSNLLSPFKSVYEIMMNSTYFGNNIWERKYLPNGKENPNYDPWRNILSGFFHFTGIDQSLLASAIGGTDLTSNRWVKGGDNMVRQDQIGTIAGSGIFQHEFVTALRELAKGDFLEAATEAGELPLKFERLSNKARNAMNNEVKNSLMRYHAEYIEAMNRATSVDEKDKAYIDFTKKCANEVAEWSARYDYVLGQNQELVPQMTRMMMLIACGEYDDSMSYVQNAYWKASQVAQIEQGDTLFLQDSDKDAWLAAGKTTEEFAAEKTRRSNIYNDTLDKEYEARQALITAGIPAKYFEQYSFDDLKSQQRIVSKKILASINSKLESPVGEFENFKEMKSYYESLIDSVSTTKDKAYYANKYNTLVTDVISKYVADYGANVLNEAYVNGAGLATQLSDYLIMPADQKYTGKSPKTNLLKDLLGVGYRKTNNLPSDDEVEERYNSLTRMVQQGRVSSAISIANDLLRKIKTGNLYASDSDYNKIVKLRALLSARSK